MYVPIFLPLPCFQTVLAHSSASVWSCCCFSSVSCFLGSPFICIFFLTDLHLPSTLCAAVSGHQWVFSRLKLFKKGLCRNTYSACLDTLAPAHSLGGVIPCPGWPAAALGCLSGAGPSTAPCTMGFGTVGVFGWLPEGMWVLVASHCRQSNCRWL